MAFTQKALDASEMIQRTQRRKELVQATAKSISQRFSDVTDFETVADLEMALEAARKEVDTINPLLSPMR